MRPIDTLVTENGKIYLNIVDLIHVIKDTIAQAKEKGIDSQAIETLFIWLAKEHTKAEEQITAAKLQKEDQHLRELQDFWVKYKESNGNHPGQHHSVPEKNSDQNPQ